MIINCQNGVMQLTFENMTLEIHIFHLSKKHMLSVEDGLKEVCIIETILEDQADQQGMQDVLNEELAEYSEGRQEAQNMKLV